jgi:hypothetical protein
MSLGRPAVPPPALPAEVAKVTSAICQNLRKITERDRFEGGASESFNRCCATVSFAIGDWFRRGC